MKKAVTFILLSIALFSCDALHRGIPKASRHQVVVNKKAQESTSFQNSDENVVFTNEVVVHEENFSVTANENSSPSELVAFAALELNDSEEIRSVVNDDTTKMAAKDTPEITPEMKRELRRSENYANKGLYSAIAALLGALIIAAVSVFVEEGVAYISLPTAMMISAFFYSINKLVKYRKLDYVTEESLLKRNITRILDLFLLLSMIAGIAIGLYLLFTLLFY